MNWVGLLFFLSGISALLYEVIWLYSLRLFMGHTIYTLSLLLAAFLAGIALGAYKAHAYKSKVVSSLVLYVLCEFGIGLYGFCFDYLLYIFQQCYSFILHFFNLGESDLKIISFIQMALSAPLILIPTTLMGATLPFMVDYFCQQKKASIEDAQMKRWALKLYALNTLGGALGLLLAGVWFTPFAGHVKTMYLAAGINMLVVLLAMYHSPQDFNKLSFKILVSLLFKRKSREHQAPSKLVWGADTWVVLGVLFSSGVLSLWTQVLWNRLANLVFGASVYIYPMVTVTVLVGIGIGAFWIQVLLLKDNSINFIKKTLVKMSLWGALSFVLAHLVYAKVPLLILQLHSYFDMSFFVYYSFMQLMTFILLLVPAVFLGTLFPLGLALLLSQSHGDSLKRLGEGVAFNIGGTILGAFTVSYFIIPYVGIEGLNWLILYGFVFLFFLFLPQGRLLTEKVIKGASFLFILFSLYQFRPIFDTSLLVEGYFYNREGKIKSDKLSDKGVLSYASYHLLFREKILAVEEDAYGLYSVSEAWKNKDSRWFKVDGKIDGNRRGGDVMNNRIISLLPSMIDKEYKDIYVVGLGTGQTAHQFLPFNHMEKVTVSEISSSMIKMAKKYFYEDSSSLWEDERFTIVNRDGREYLRQLKESLDLVVSLPSNPWVNGVGSLYTVEYFQTVYESLREGGIISTWFHTYSLECPVIESVLLAMLEIFPNMEVFKIGANIFMLGQKGTEKIKFNYELNRNQNLDKAWTTIFEKLNIDHPLENMKTLLPKNFHKSHWIISGYLLEEYKLGAVVNTDDNRFVQYQAGKGYWRSFSCPIEQYFIP